VDTTVEGTINRLKRDVSLGSRGPVYTLASQHVTGETTIHLNEVPAMAGPGSIATMGITDYYILDADQIGKTLNVIPAFHGTPDETHDPPMVVYIDDSAPASSLIDFMDKEIRSWQDKLWRVATLPITSSKTQRIYDFPVANADVKQLLEVRRASPGIAWLNWAWDDDRTPRVKAKLLRTVDIAAHPTGLALQVETHPPDGTLYAAYATPFDLSPFDLTTDLVTNVGLDADWVSILEAGVRARLLSASIASRADWRAGGHTRKAEEVTLLDVVRAAQVAMADRDMALNNAANTLRGRWPFAST